jgi:hypothetical protein
MITQELMPRIMKLHRYIDNDSQMTPIDFQVTRSKVKVTVPKNVFTQWLPQQLTIHMGGMHVLQTALVWNLFYDIKVMYREFSYLHILWKEIWIVNVYFIYFVGILYNCGTMYGTWPHNVGWQKDIGISKGKLYVKESWQLQI